MTIQIAHSASDFEREPLVKPFGFKGGFMQEIWQTACALTSRSGATGIGLGTQGVLWSDSRVFAGFSEAAGNAIMYLMTEYALRRAAQTTFTTPFELLDQLLPQVERYGRQLTGNDRLRPTFALNALVPVDNAAWMLYSMAQGTESFDALLAPAHREALAHRHRKVVAIPLISYAITVDEVKQLVDEGYWLLKIKIGADPDKDGDQDKMLAWDMDRLSVLHDLLKRYHTPDTESGHLLYYLDANGRYDSMDRLMRLLDHAKRIGALDRIVLLEEPFPEDYLVDVHNVPARLAADESAHTDAHARERIDLGYRALALKPIAKTMSMSVRIARLAFEQGVPCFCADLTVNPILVDWNKTVASRLAPLPGLRTGILETNGHQIYRNWAAMRAYHPCADAPWTRMSGGFFETGDEFFAASGGIFRPSRHYRELLRVP